MAIEPPRPGGTARRAALGTLGFFGGAGIGAVATLTAIWLWFDVLGNGAGRPKPGLDWLFTLGPVLMLGGGIAGAVWLLRRERAGRPVGWVAGVCGIGLLALAAMLMNLAG